MQLKEIIGMNSEDTTIELYGNNVIVSSDKKIYASLFKKYENLACKTSKSFESEYTKKNDVLKNVEMVRDNVLDMCISSIIPLIKEIRSDLTSIRIYDYTDESILLELKDKGYFNIFLDKYEELCDEIDRIDMQLLGEKAYRESRKENRGRWEVTTFGGSWGDAIGNQLQAETINLAGGLAHSVVNAIGNSISESEAKNKKANLYTSNLKKGFVNAVYDVCLKMHMYIVGIMHSHGMSINDAVISASDKAKALNIYENYKNLSVSDDVALDMLGEALMIDPLFEAVYVETLIRFGDMDNKLEKYAKLYGINIYAHKEKISVAKYEKKFGNINEEEALKNIENEVIQLVEGYGLKYGKSEVKKIYTEKIFKLDLQFRTVDGIIFEERSEAEIARKELEEISKLMSSIGQPRYLDDEYEEELKICAESISKYTTKIKEKYFKKIENLLNEYDLNYRSVAGIVFITREESNLAREELKQIANIMPTLSNKVNRIDSGYESMLLHKKDDILKYKTAVKNQYIAKINEKLDEYDKFYKTVSYLENETIFQTREEADKARKEVEYIKNIVKDVSEPSKDSLFDYKEDIENSIN